MTGGASSGPGTTVGELLADLTLDPHLRAQLAAEAAEPGARMHRRFVPVLTPRTDVSMPAWAGGTMPHATFGPLEDPSGLSHWIDVYRPIRNVRLVRAAGGVPFLTVRLRVPLLELEGRSNGAARSWHVAAGSVWFATTLVSSAAPSASYSGLRVSGGTLAFDQDVLVGGDEIVVPTSARVDLTLDLDPGTPVSGSGPGGDSRAAALGVPATAYLHISATGANLFTTDTLRVLAYGTDVVLVPADTAPRYDPDEQALVVPMRNTPESFTISTVASAIFTPSGTAPIVASGWTIPSVVSYWSDLGEAAGAGGLTLWLGKGLTASWLGQPVPVNLNDCAIVVTNGQLEIVARSGTGDQITVSPRPGGLDGARIAIYWGEHVPLTFFSSSGGSELVLTEGELAAALPQPVDLSGQTLPLLAPHATVGVVDDADHRRLLVMGSLEWPNLPRKLVSFSLTNAVLTSTYPFRVVVVGEYDGVALTSALLDLTFGLAQIRLTLPDPYAANNPWSLVRDAGSSEMHSRLWWDATQSGLDFRLSRDVQFGGSQENSSFNLQGLADAVDAPATDSDRAANTAQAIATALAFERHGGDVLLDVSTNVDQFGVALAPVSGAQRRVEINDLTLSTGTESVVLLTLPAVQWEPVLTPDPEPGFPPRLTFANSGVPSIIQTPRSVDLVPVRPDTLLDRLVADLEPQRDESDGQPSFDATDEGKLTVSVAARFTLPFGIVALAELSRPIHDRPRGAAISWNRPRTSTLTGAHQLRIDAVDRSLPDGTPSLPGFTVQLPVAQPGNQSVLADGILTFNTYLGDSGARPLVPVVRLDLSGYGESLFSNWRNPYNEPRDEVGVIQARFDVAIGRTSYEVIQLRSWLFPYAVEVVRTFTMQRQNNASVVRTDSGWVAVTDGLYVFPNGLKTHPGVVTKITKVGRIRETGRTITQDGYTVAPVYFDGELTLDGASGGVPARDQLGFVQLTGGPLLDAPAYASLIAAAGPLGGPIDSSLNVGGGNQIVHLNHVDVGSTEGMGGPEFVMTAWGAPSFPGGGQWSTLRIPGPGQAPTPVDRSRGTPLIRAGLAGTSPSPAAPYRFCDPEDLARPTNPQADYAILHAMGTQRAVFPRPKIEATDTSRITSTQRGAIADPYVLAASPGPFPALNSALPFPDANWSIAVDGSGNYRLDLPGASFHPSVGRRTARQAGSVRSDLDYTNAEVTYIVDTSAVIPWSFRLDGAAKIMATSSLGDVTTLRANVVSAADHPTRFEDPHLAMGGSFSVVHNLLTILADLGITGFLTTEMTNDWTLKITEKVPIVDAHGRPYQIPPAPWPEPPGLPDPQIKFDDCQISSDAKVAPTSDEAEFDLGGGPMFHVSNVPGLYVVAIFKFSIKVSTADGTVYGLLLGVGIAYQKELGPFEFKGLLAITFYGFISDAALGLGVGFLLQLTASIDPIIEVQLSLEGQLAIVVGCRDDHTKASTWGAAKLTFAVDVTVCLCFSISFEASTTSSSLMSGPGEPTCSLPDVIPSAS